MFIPQSYSLAVILCIVTMLCWGSWGNTQKLAGKTWRFELFYWDYVLGIVLFSLLLGFTLGSTGENGRGFINDISQAETVNISKAMLGGVIFNASNIFLWQQWLLQAWRLPFRLVSGSRSRWGSLLITYLHRKVIRYYCLQELL
jgi:hypothetical protein